MIILKRNASNFQPAYRVGGDAAVRGVCISHSPSSLSKEKEAIALSNAVVTVFPILLKKIIEN